METTMKKERLEGMLKEIKRLKLENYSGTRSLWNQLTATYSIKKMPQYVADTLNRLNYFGEKDYRATPARVVGLAKIPEKVWQHYLEMREEGNTKNVYEADRLLYPTYQTVFRVGRALDQEVMLGWEASNQAGLKSLINYQRKLFREANRHKVKSDSSFGVFYENYIDGLIDKININLPQFKEKSEELRNITMDFLSNFDWNRNLSEDALKEHQDTACRNVLYRWEGILERINRDQVSHRGEYRRQVIRRFIEQFEGNPQNYNQVIEVLDKEIQLYKKFKDLPLIGGLFGSSLPTFQQLRLFCGSERNYINKILKEDKK